MLAAFARKALSPLLVSAGARFDVAAVRLAQEVSKRGSRRVQSVDDRLHYLDGVAARYADVDPAAFYSAPALPHVREHHVRPLTLGEVVDLTYPSGFHPHDAAQAERFAKWRANHFAHVRLFRGKRPGRPVIVCIHGYRAGAFGFEERSFAAEWLYGLGLDVALFTLPFHALRAPEGRKGAPLFPTADVGRTIEAFGQAIHDLRALMAHLRKDEPARAVGVMGMSLGGYTTSLLATIEPSLTFAIPFIPLSDMTDVVVQHEALRGTAVPESLVTAGKRAMTLARPLARASVLPSDRVLVIGAEGDRITPRTHAEALAAHFGSEIVFFPGAHLLQFGRGEAFGRIARFLAARGLVGGRRKE